MDKDTSDLLPAYSGSCNPPRRAKRLRTDSLSQTPSASAGPSTQHKILPKPTPVDLDIDEPDEETPSPPPRRRGRKPGTLSRSARESLRKENHSRIEKARRTKINDALATLRRLVPVDYNNEEEGARSRRDEKQKEFKLEVLVRTVAYMQDLIERVRVLEEGMCASCGDERKAVPSIVRVRATGSKRKRLIEDDERDGSQSDVDELLSDAEEEEEEAVPSLPKPKPQERQEQPSEPEPPTPTMLPSISSWLPKPYVDPSYIALSASTSPQIAPQLPSPPLSTQFRPTVSTQLPPSLALPSPHLFEVARPRADSINTIALPQAWTVDDESAASMLLRISSSSSSSASASPPMRARRPSWTGAGAVEPQTPGRLLGLGTSRGRA